MDTKDLEQQGAKIAEARKNKNMTQEQLANLLHVGKQAVSNWENGKNDLDPETSQHLERILGIQLRQRQPLTKAMPFMKGIKDLRQIRTTEELKAQLELVLDCVPFDSAYSASVRRILKLLFFASLAQQTGDKIILAIEKNKDFREEAYTTSWDSAAEYLQDITSRYETECYGEFWQRSYPKDPVEIKTEDLLETAVKYILVDTEEKIGDLEDDGSIHDDDCDYQYMNKLLCLGYNSSHYLIVCGLLPNYYSPIGLSLRVAIFEFFTICTKIDLELGILKSNEDYDAEPF